MNDVGASAELAVLLRLHIGLEGLRHEVGRGDPKDDLGPAFLGHLRKIRASLAAPFANRGALVGR